MGAFDKFWPDVSNEVQEVCPASFYMLGLSDLLGKFSKLGLLLDRERGEKFKKLVYLFGGEPLDINWWLSRARPPDFSRGLRSFRWGYNYNID